MSSVPAGDDRRGFDLKKAVDLIGAVAAVLAPAAVFYVLGYIVIQAYVVAVRVNASFWFTEHFYREAGASLLLAALGSIVLLPHVVVPLAVLLTVLLPGAAAWRTALPPRAGRLLGGSMSSFLRAWMFAVVVAVALLGIALLLAGATASGLPGGEAAWTATAWLFTDHWLFPDWFLANLDVAKPLRYPTAVLFALALPVLVALAVLATRAARDGWLAARLQAGQAPAARPLAALLWGVSLVVVGSFVAIGYGAFYFDVGAVPLIDAEKCRPVPAAGEGRPAMVDCYLLARFDERYILFGWQAGAGEARGMAPLYVKQVKDLEPFSLAINPGLPLRVLRSAYDRMSAVESSTAVAETNR